MPHTAVYNENSIYKKDGGFCLTDKGLVTRPQHQLEDRDNGMLKGAREFFHQLCWSDSPKTKAWFVNVVDAKKTVEGAPAKNERGFAGISVDEWALTFEDNSVKNIWVVSYGYPEGYAFEVCESKKESILSVRFAQGWHATECLECGAVFSRPGHVEPGMMACDRCR